jgi:predicted nucleic acid-binding protein
MSKVVLDTDVLIDLLRGRGAAKVFLQEMTAQSVPCCSVISVAEIYAGMRSEESELTTNSSGWTGYLSRYEGSRRSCRPFKAESEKSAVGAGRLLDCRDSLH